MVTATPTTSPRIQVGVLEDQQILRESLTHLLQASGFDVPLACSTVEELNALLPSVRPDIVLVDLRLHPGDTHATGWAAIDHLQRWYPAIRVVVISSSRDPTDVERAQRARAAGFLPKDSLSSDQLVTALARVHQGDAVFPFRAAFGVGAPGRTGATGESAAAERSPLPAALASLTARELETLQYVAAGHDNDTIAACLGITERTVRAHVSALYRKLGSENRAQLALLARELGVRPPK